MQNYKIDVLTYHENNSVRSDCADIAFQNNGTVDVTINQSFTLTANGGVLSLSANEGEIDRTIYTFSFPAGSPIGNCNLIVIRKIYI
jgi:hypothetical protein